MKELPETWRREVHVDRDTDRRTRHRRVMAPTEITVLVKAKQEKVKANATSVFAPPLQ